MTPIPRTSTAASITARSASISSSGSIELGGRRSRSDDPQCRLGRPDPSRLFRGDAASVRRGSADAGPRGTRLPPELHLRALPDHFRPPFGEQIAWAESNAIVFRQLGHRRAHQPLWRLHRPVLRLTGRVPDYGLHAAENRRARILFEVDSRSRRVG